MEYEEMRDYLLSIMQRVNMENGQMEFKLITSRRERKALKQHMKILHALLRLCESTEEKLYHYYIKEYLTPKAWRVLGKDTEAISTITDWRHMVDAVDFLRKEIDTVKDMLWEYYCYIRTGHFLEFILGRERTEENLVDSRF